MLWPWHKFTGEWVWHLWLSLLAEDSQKLSRAVVFGAKQDKGHTFVQLRTCQSWLLSCIVDTEGARTKDEWKMYSVLYWLWFEFFRLSECRSKWRTLSNVYVNALRYLYCKHFTIMIQKLCEKNKERHSEEMTGNWWETCATKVPNRMQTRDATVHGHQGYHISIDIRSQKRQKKSRLWQHHWFCW